MRRRGSHPTSSAAETTSGPPIARAARPPASTTHASATQPSSTTTATYRMLSQWTNPERNVIALPAEYGVPGSETRTAATSASAPPAKYFCGRVSRRRRQAAQPATPARPATAIAPWRRGQWR